MTGLPEFNFPAFFRVAEIVRQQGHEAINPAEAAPPDMPWAVHAPSATASAGR